MTPHFERQGIAIDGEEHRRRVEFHLDAAAIVECDGQDVGMIKVLRDGTTWTIEQFQLAPAHQGKGLGAAVLRAVIADARASGAQLSLSVLKQNPAARLYQRLGFRTLSETDHSFKMTLAETEVPLAP